MTVAGRPPAASPSTSSLDRRQLEDERGLLLRSIEDLDAERDSGDISEADHRALRDQYVARAAAVLRALEGAAPEEPPLPGAGRRTTSSEPEEVSPTPVRRWRRRRILLWGAIVTFVAAAVVLVATEVTSRLPGETASGSIALSNTQERQRTLAQAQVLESEGDDAQALTLYHEVLEQDPTQEEALAESGWLEFEAGVLAKNGTLLAEGQAAEQKAQQADPSDYGPHLYLGSMLLVEQEFQQAAAQFDRFLADDPPVSLEQTAWPYVVRAFDQAGEAVPPVPAGVKG